MNNARSLATAAVAEDKENLSPCRYSPVLIYTSNAASLPPSTLQRTSQLTTRFFDSSLHLATQTSLPLPPSTTTAKDISAIRPPQHLFPHQSHQQRPSLPRSRQTSLTNAQHLAQTPQRHPRQPDQQPAETQLRGHSARDLLCRTAEGVAEAASVGWVWEEEERGEL